MANVAFLSFYSGEVERGVETFVYELTKRLTKKHKITIFQAGSSIKNPVIRTYTVRTFINPPKFTKSPLSKFYLDTNSLKILIFTLRIIPKILKGNFDVIFPVNGGWQALLTRIISKFSGSKIIISGHAGVGSDDAFNLFTRPDAFVALTTAQKVWANNISGEVRTELIPNGVDLAAFNPQVKPKKISLKKPIVVCASALDSYKRLDLTIKAIAKAQDLSLLILGTGEKLGEVDSLGKRLLKERFLRVKVPYAQMAPYYRNGSVFTLASQTEAFGISYLEAMACNLPVVTTKDSARAEIIGDAGILCETRDITEYATALKLVVNTRYRNAPYNQALKFSWNKIAQKYSNLISEITK